MVDEFVYNKPQDPIEDIFERLESQFVEINHNMNFLMASLARNLGSFRDDGGSNSENKSKRKSKDQEDLGKESGNESEK